MTGKKSLSHFPSSCPSDCPSGSVRTGLRLFAVSFVVLFLYNFPNLNDPPYWDGIVGIFSQSVWLKDHNLNLVELWNQPDYYGGGPREKALNLVAYLVAVLYSFLSPAAVFVVLHLFTITCAALAFSLSVLVLIDFIPLLPALLWGAAAIFEPVFSGQTAAIYLEMPSAASWAVVVFFMHRRQYWGAAAACILAYFIKSSATLLACVLFVWVLGCLLLTRNPGSCEKEACCPTKKGRRFIRDPRFILFAPFPVCFLLDLMQGSDNSISIHADRLLFMAVNLVPGLVAMVIVSALLSLWWLFRQGIRDFLAAKDGAEFIFFLLLLVAAFWASMSIYYLPLCRYATVIVFPLFSLIAIVLFSLTGKGKLLSVTALFILLFHLVNQTGAFYPDLPPPLVRSGDFLERSREYLADLRANRIVCREIEEKYKDHAIVAKYPFVQMLTMPELGYVTRALGDIYAAGGLPRYTNAKAYKNIVAGRQTLFLYSPTIYEFSWKPSLTPSAGDKALIVERSFPVPLILYSRTE